MCTRVCKERVCVRDGLQACSGHGLRPPHCFKIDLGADLVTSLHPATVNSWRKAEREGNKYDAGGDIVKESV